MEETRARVISAACDLLDSADEDVGFSIDAVAKRAGVARMTIYNKFTSKAGLLEELFDALAAKGEFGQMADIFREPDPLVALDALIGVFGRFWTANRRGHRRLRAAATLDPELATAMAARNERRRRGLTTIVSRLDPPIGSGEMSREEIINVLFVVTSYDSFDMLAGEANTPADMVPTVQRLARAVLRR
jgi:AcrR family transcriptional regulator